jgi:ribosome maturation factor RimP
MSTDTQIGVVKQKINELLAEHPTHFLVEIRIKPTNNFKVFVDADEGVNLAVLIEYNRKLYKFIEGKFSVP